MNKQERVSGWPGVLIATVALAMMLGVTVRSAPAEQGLVESSYQRARAVLDAGVKALGPAPDDLSLHLQGRLYQRQQSPSASETVTVPVNGWITLDLKGSRVAWDVEASFPGGFPIRQGVRISGPGNDQATLLNNQLKTSQAFPNPPAPTLENFLNRIPHSILARATQRANTLRWVGESQFRGKPHNVITFSTVNGTQMALWFDKQSSILAKWELLGSDAYLGDAVTEIAYKGWQDTGGFKFPTGQTLSIGGEAGQDYDYSDVHFNAKPADTTFAAPEGYRAFTPPPVPLKVNKLADDVYAVEGMGPQGAYTSLAVGFTDYVLVVEAPIGDAVVKTLLQKVREVFPGKPVRYVTTTHHHSDHAGGIRTMMAEGITVVTTPGNAAYFEKTAQRHFTLPADALELKPQKPKFETISGRKRVFSDASHSAELIDIGPNPHASELLVVWLPKERILFEGDMFFKNPDNSTAAAAPATQSFADALARLRIEPDTFVGVHQRVYKREELQASLDLGKQQGTLARQ